MATEFGLLDGNSPDDSINSKYKVIDVLEAGEKALKSTTLESFNKKARSLTAGILTTDDSEDIGGLLDDREDAGLVFPSDIFDTGSGDDGCEESLVFMDHMFGMSDEDSDEDGDMDGYSDDEDDEMANSDILLEE